MKKIVSTCAIILFSVLAGSTSKSAERDFILESVKDLQPVLSDAAAMRLARAVEEVSADKSCDLPWQILLSVAFNESSLIKNRVGRRNPASPDFGLMQINKKMTLRLGVNARKLLSDERYSLSTGCRILRENKDRYGKKLSYWIGLYRSGTAIKNERIRKNAKSYHKMIMATAHRIGYYEGRKFASY